MASKGKRLQRSVNCRPPIYRILIVSEGKKTEPNYFNEIRKYYRLSTATVKVLPSDMGTNPINIVDYARKIFCEGDNKRGLDAQVYDEVYAVFDRDEHPYYKDAIEKMESLSGKYKNDLKQKVPFYAIPSNPCFELWILLHYKNIFNLQHRHDIFAQVKEFITNYDKGMVGVFSVTQTYLAEAKSRAKSINAKGSPLSEDFPYTAVVNLVEKLETLRK